MREKNTSFVSSRLLLLGVALLITMAVLPLVGVQAATSLPANFSETLIVSGLSSPTAMAFAPDGRLFILQQSGQVRIYKNGALLATPFMTLSVDSRGERGLLGIAFHPNFATNQYLYLYYTVSGSPAYNRIVRVTANGDVVLPGSETPIMRLEDLSSATNHNGGAMHFGLDGKLYVAVGENANTSHSQTLNNRLGKMLRLNPDGTIPTDNPFYAAASGDNRAIWALGLRNPFTFAVQPGTGRIFINDVGAGQWEEINDGIAGANYGWPSTEGYTSNPDFVSPLYAYPHAGPISGCAITGGVFYNPATVRYPVDYVGDYFFADYCSNWIRRYDVSTDSPIDFATNMSTGAVVDLKVGPDGLLYYLGRGWSSNAGAIYRINYNAPATPTRTPTASPTPNNQRPVATITAPAVNTRYNAGQVIQFAGTGTDAEDGTLPASAFEWEIVFHHDTHTHPFLQPTSGITSGQFTIDTLGHLDANVFYRIYLRVRDSAGQITETYRDIFPNVVTLGLLTSPTGLQVNLEGQPRTAPHNVQAVVGTVRNFDVVSPQTLGGTTYYFSRWSNGGTRNQNVTVPGANTSYQAVFLPAAPANADVITNGTFAAGLGSWDYTGLMTQVVGGVLEIARWSGTNAGVFTQTVARGVPTNAPLELQLQMGNRSSVPKSIAVVLRGMDWTNARLCHFTLPAFSPLQTYTLRTLAPAAWSPLIVQGWLNEPDGQMALLVDNVTLAHRPALSPTGTECTVTPPTNVNLLFNGDFSGGHTNWAFWNSYAAINGGVLDLARWSATPNGGFYQWNPYAAPANSTLELNFSIGNSSAVPKVVHLLLRHPTWSEIRGCWLTIPAGAPLRAYTMRARTNAPWPNVVLQGWIEPADGLPALRLDNLTLRYLPGITLTTPVECPTIVQETPSETLPTLIPMMGEGGISGSSEGEAPPQPPTPIPDVLPTAVPVEPPTLPTESAPPDAEPDKS